MSKTESYTLWGDKGSPPPYSGSDEPPAEEGAHPYNTKGDEREGNQWHVDKAKTEDVEERGTWGNKAEFMLSCIGLSVGLGNVWRFPYLAYQNGGAAFVIAYLILQLTIGKPMYFLELVLGQYSAKGPTGVWAMNPSAKGIGIAMMVISLIVAIYYNVIMGYTLYYMFASMQETLPWTYCREEWKAEGCVVRTGPLQYCTGNATYDAMFDNCKCTFNSVIDSAVPYNCSFGNETVRSAAEFYFYKEVIQRSTSIDPSGLGSPIWKLVLCLLLSWIIVILCLIKGVKSSGKVVYFTATFPYLILLILLVRGATLDGAIIGVEFFIVPDWSKLADLSVWAAAAGQMFFSLSVCFGGIIMFGSYNKFNNNIYIDALIISVMDLVTSIIAGFVIFTTFGAMAKKLDVPITQVAQAGYGLAFVAYPEALSTLPIPQLWSVLFFFMLFTLGLDSEFALLETTLTCLQDEMPRLRKYKSIMCVIAGVICFLIALTCATPGGDYVVTIMDYYGADFSVLFVAACECVAVFWVYGVRRFMQDVTYMMGYKPHPTWYWMICWAFIAPVVITLLFCYRVATDGPKNYPDGTLFPFWTRIVGYCLTATVLGPIPIWFVFAFVKAPGTFFERLRHITTPTPEWVPNDGKDHTGQHGYALQPIATSLPYVVDDKSGVGNPAYSGSQEKF